MFEKGGEVVALDLVGRQVSNFLLSDLEGPEATARRSSASTSRSSHPARRA